MKLTWHPRNFVLAIVLLTLFGIVLNAAVDFRNGLLVGVAALVAYVAIELALTFNPAGWRRHGR